MQWHCLKQALLAAAHHVALRHVVVPRLAVILAEVRRRSNSYSVIPAFLSATNDPILREVSSVVIE